MPKLIVTLMLSCFGIAASAQTSLFIGTWQVAKSPVTHVSNITLNISLVGVNLSGTIVLVNPDHTTMRLPILRPSANQRTLSFETVDGQNPMRWSLTVDKSRKRGVLRGAEHEMLIEEKVTKTGSVAENPDHTTYLRVK